MGRGIVEAGLGRTERLELEQRTSDPTTTKQGEAWLRADVAPATDQIATVRFDHGSGTWDLPVFDVAASTTNVEKVLRIPVGGTVGFIPTTASGGAFSPLRLQHGGNTLQFHDSLEASVIPDSGDLHARYDATELSQSDGQTVSTWADATGNGYDLSASGGPTYIASGINGNPIVRLDGADDLLETTWTELPQPNTIFAVAQPVTAGQDADERLFSGPSGARHILWTTNDANSNGWRMNAGTTLFSGVSEDSNPHILSTLYASTGEFRYDGTQEATGDVGSNGMGGITLGADAGGGAYGDFDIGEVLVYPQDKSGIYSEVESYLSDKWGIAV